MKSFKHFAYLWVLLYPTWLILNASLAPQVLISGFFVVLILTLLLGRKVDFFAHINLGPRGIIAVISYFFVFVIALIKANLDVAARVISPTLKINPGIVKIKTKLKSDIGKMMLANSITLTPGTLTVDIKGEFLYIHWVDVTSEDVDEATQKISASFEKYLEVIYG